MAELAFHVTMKMFDEQVLAATAALRRRLSRCIWERADSPGVLAFRLADTHVHVLFCGSRAAACRLAHAVECSLRHHLSLPPRFDAARIRPIRGRDHLARSFDYVMLQDVRHETFVDPLHEGGSMLDLLGLRVTGRSTRSTVRRALPAVDRAHLVGLMLRGLDVTPAAFDPTPTLGGDGLESLRESVLSAACLPSLSGRSAPVFEAHVAALHAALPWTSPSAAAARLGVPRSTAHAWVRREPDPALVAAIQAQLHLRAHLPAVGF